jgi:histidinol-phosphate aminotransferase
MEPSGGLVLANPNAPTGIAADLPVIEQLARRDPDRLVLVDEAYIDFGGQSAVSLLDRCDNILVVQTCSKSRPWPGFAWASRWLTCPDRGPGTGAGLL